MVLLLAVLFMTVIALAIILYLQIDLTRELKNAHVNLAAEVGVVRREGKSAVEACRSDVLSVVHREIINFRDDAAHNLQEATSYLQKSDALADAYAKALNERLVLLEIEKTATPKPAEETPPPRRSFASQKARAEAGARK